MYLHEYTSASTGESYNVELKKRKKQVVKDYIQHKPLHEVTKHLKLSDALLKVIKQNKGKVNTKFSIIVPTGGEGGAGAHSELLRERYHHLFLTLGGEYKELLAVIL